MAAPAIIQRPGAVLYDSAGVAYLGTTATEGVRGDAMGATDSSGCIFWCAVALGALAKGSPIESVSRSNRAPHTISLPLYFMPLCGLLAKLFHVYIVYSC